MTDCDSLLNSVLCTREYFQQEDICRLCWSKDASNELVSRMLSCNLKSPLFFKVQSCLDIDLSEDDLHHPRKICQTCFSKIEQFNNFKVFCQDTNQKLNAILGDKKFVFEEPIKVESIERSFDIINVVDAESLDSISEDCEYFDSSGSIIQETSKSIHKSSVKSGLKDIQQPKQTSSKTSIIPTESGIHVAGKHTHQKPIETLNTPKKKKIPYTFCNMCSVELENEEAYLNHKSEKHGIEKDGRCRCFGCGKLFNNRKTRLAHESHHCRSLEYGFKCNICGQYLPFRSLYEKHLKYHRLNKIKDSPDDSGGIFKCENCDEKFVRRSEWLGHLLEHKQKKNKMLNSKRSRYERASTYCNTCFIDLQDKEAYLNHNSEAHGIERDGKFRCFGCGKLFNNRKTRLTHEGHYCKDLEHGFKCNLCGRYLPLRGPFERHLNHHRLNTLKDPPDDSGGIFNCVKCNERFNKRSEWHKHLIKHKHDGRKDYICETCGKAFSRQNYLNVHVAIHTGLKRYKCTICDYKSVQKNNITIHMRKHTNERPYACDLCPQRCVSASNLRAHRRRHLGLNKFQCSFCNKTFGYKQTLNEHISIKHQRSQSNTCEVCGAEYALRSGLRRHERRKHPELMHKTNVLPDPDIEQHQNRQELYPNNDGEKDKERVPYSNNDVNDKNKKVGDLYNIDASNSEVVYSTDENKTSQVIPSNDGDKNKQEAIHFNLNQDYELLKKSNNSLMHQGHHKDFDLKVKENDRFVCFQKCFSTKEGENIVIVLQEQEQ